MVSQLINELLGPIKIKKIFVIDVNARGLVESTAYAHVAVVSLICRSIFLIHCINTFNI